MKLSSSMGALWPKASVDEADEEDTNEEDVGGLAESVAKDSRAAGLHRVYLYKRTFRAAQEPNAK